MRPLKDDQRLLAGGEGVPVRVGARHVSAQGAAVAASRVEQEWQVRRERLAVDLRDQRGEAVLADQRVEHVEACFAESRRDVHPGN